jgi:hypothetical protein
VHSFLAQAEYLGEIACGLSIAGVARVAGLAPALVGAAGLSVFAHLEDLVSRGLVATDGPPTLDAEYRLA